MAASLKRLSRKSYLGLRTYQNDPQRLAYLLIRRLSGQGRFSPRIRAAWRGPCWQNCLSGAHSQAMILLKILDFLVAICVASMIALTLGFLAHYVFGLSRLDIRASALTGAAIFALLVATEWFAKLRKSK